MFSADQRNAIFNGSSVEGIVDASGTYIAPPQNPNVFTLTTGTDTVAGTIFTNASVERIVDASGTYTVNASPTITSNGGGDTATLSLAENTTAVTAVTATDPDAGQTLSYSIVGGADAGKFTIDATGALAFRNHADFELPADANGDNVYDAIVQVSDGLGGIDTQAIAVTAEERHRKHGQRNQSGADPKWNGRGGFPLRDGR